ncbi:uncharacterized protein PFL1_05081 [Pseudozyma flocculosa PF-1]|uniref:Uncharacterized protein n=2 Tax=Pseudozyma flocculosa TaxID=84751 RepID=A0A5C3EVZ0_9BASI|nr:uncharacterized protein PFL1_05081 [Pseudozyma flocculosa PF-1]EPQ27543.1 hypothetical protein PFL1_05081 [Pseudozyma flocculosa PF-1]SPO36020.1 uncharacterized protein PSFLO_01491 [Pseudozyma flocculosa]
MPGPPEGAMTSQVEDWGEGGDFDLTHQADPDPDARVLSAPSDDRGADSDDWDVDLGHDAQPVVSNLAAPDDEDEDQTDTIKLSNAAGSALKLMLDAQRSGPNSGIVTQLGSRSTVASADDVDDDWGADLEIPDSLPFDLNALHQRRASFTSDLEGEEPFASASASTTTSTSYKSNLGISTDFTDPECSPKKGAGGGASTSDSSATSLLCPSYQFRGRGDAASLGQEADSETDIEQDFELDPSLDTLSLSPAVSRKRSRATLDHEGLLWGDENHKRSPSPGPKGTLSRSQSHSSNLGDGVNGPAAFGAESDADDEHEDLLDGLVLDGSVFEVDAASTDPKAAIEITETLEAILNVRRAGEPSDGGPSCRQSDGPVESEADLAGGLIITDDLDLSPSRLSNNKLSYRTRSRGPLPAGPSHSRSVLVRHPSLPAASSSTSSASSSTFSHLWLGRETASRPSASTNLSVPTRGEVFSPHARQRTLSQLSSSTSLTQSSEAGPSQQHGHAQPRPRAPKGKGLQYKRSASDLQQKMTDSPAPQNRARNKGLARKRSLPSLADRFRQQGRPSSSGSTAPAGGPSVLSTRTPSSFSSRLTASTAASRARAAETAADILARMAKDSPPPPLPGTSPAGASSRSLATMSRATARVRPSTADDGSPSRRAQSPHPLRQGRVSSPLVQSPPSTHFLRRTAAYGDGAELDAIEDLPSTTGASSISRSRPERPPRSGSNESASRGHRGRSKPPSKPGLIKPLGASSITQKTVKGMRWNPKTLRWDGNEGALREFDSVVQSSVRPALISQLTGSSTNSALASLSGYTSPVLQDSSSLITNIACGVKMVGDMIFDPIQMKWVHRNCEEDAEVFAQFEEEGFSSEGAFGPQSEAQVASCSRSVGSECGSDMRPDASAKGNSSWDVESTIRARKMRSGPLAGRLEERWSPSLCEATKLIRSPGGPRGARLPTRVEAAVAQAVKSGSMPNLEHVDEALWNSCLEAEARHRSEVHSFLPRTSSSSSQLQTQKHVSALSGALEYAPTMGEIERPRPHLYHLQRIARGLGKGSDPPMMATRSRGQ